eukprot:NODE_19928_length_822_cov_1.434532.p6 GENE.NODE_19928_length_822_cov_1.434532~~NODE_19928_length_822_cov_1.434532.p6  ORF type:complete len:52 (+),score=7.03 NODE_19928_length_822_cov_1.434532:38-193(+)
MAEVSMPTQRRNPSQEGGGGSEELSAARLHKPNLFDAVQLCCCHATAVGQQ